MKVIKMIAIDVDGCITPGEGEAANLGVLKKLNEFNMHSASDPAVPALTLNTGRQQPFVDLMCQMIGTRVPALFENGAGLYVPETYEFLYHPSITGEWFDRLAEFKKVLKKEMVLARTAKLQPGKEVSFSVYPEKGFTVEDNARQLGEIFEKTGYEFDLDVSILCINILIPGLDKGAGLLWLADFTGLNTDEMGAIGDAPGDLPAFELAGVSGAPAQAEPEVREAADYKALKKNGRGVISIIEEVIHRNRELLK